MVSAGRPGSETRTARALADRRLTTLPPTRTWKPLALAPLGSAQWTSIERRDTHLAAGASVDGAGGGAGAGVVTAGVTTLVVVIGVCVGCYGCDGGTATTGA